MSSFFLKIFALIFMIIDHTGYVLFPDQIIFRIIGRLAFPLFAYQMAVGYSHTKNKPKHILKLLLFAILCQIPSNLMNALYSTEISLNIIFTFVLALLVIMTIEKFPFLSKDENVLKINLNFKNFLITCLLSILLLLIGVHLNVDYSWYGILLTVAFYFTLSNKTFSILCFFILLLLNLIVKADYMSLLALISIFDCVFILFFNGKRGYKFSWIFYALYFLHFFPLLYIRHHII